MKTVVVRLTAAVLAVATVVSGLKAVAVLADVESASPTVLVVLPRVVVTANAAPVEQSDVAQAQVPPTVQAPL